MQQQDFSSIFLRDFLMTWLSNGTITLWFS